MTAATTDDAAVHDLGEGDKVGSADPHAASLAADDLSDDDQPL